MIAGQNNRAGLMLRSSRMGSLARLIEAVTSPITVVVSASYAHDALLEKLAPTGLYFLECPSTSVPLKSDSILYPESYCRLAPPRIHFGFGQEDCLDGF